MYKTRIIIFSLMVLFLNKPSYGQIFAGYDQFCNVPVITVQNPQGASAANYNGNAVIFVDPSVMANMTLSRIFTLAHECGHFALGHTLPQGQWFRNTQVWATKEQELEADCWAAQQLVAIRDINDIQRMITIFSNQGDMAIGFYPTGTERAVNIKTCLGLPI